MDTKGLKIHTVRLIHSVGGNSYYETADAPTGRIAAASKVERDGESGIWITTAAGATFWTPVTNVLEITWGKAVAEGKKVA